MQASYPNSMDDPDPDPKHFLSKSFFHDLNRPPCSRTFAGLTATPSRHVLTSSQGSHQPQPRSLRTARRDVALEDVHSHQLRPGNADPDLLVVGQRKLIHSPRQFLHTLPHTTPAADEHGHALAAILRVDQGARIKTLSKVCAGLKPGESEGECVEPTVYRSENNAGSDVFGHVSGCVS